MLSDQELVDAYMGSPGHHMNPLHLRRLRVVADAVQAEVLKPFLAVSDDPKYSYDTHWVGINMRGVLEAKLREGMN